MLSKLLLGLSLVGAEWVLYLLIGLSIFSLHLILERLYFYHQASQGLAEFRVQIRAIIHSGKWEEALSLTELRSQAQSLLTKQIAQDLETEMVFTLLSHFHQPAEVLGKLAQDAVLRAKLKWDKNLSTLATIGSNAPFIGLFGTVLGIMRAFHDLTEQAHLGGGAQTVSLGISESLVATAVGLWVAIPAVVAFNVFQKRVKNALMEAEALKCYLIGKQLKT